MRWGRRCALILTAAATLGLIVYATGSGSGGQLRRPSTGPSIRTSHAEASILPAASEVTTTTAGNQPEGNVFSAPSVATFLSRANDNLTAAVYNEDTGVTSLYRPGVAEDTASIMKVDILATMLAQAQADGTGLSATQQDLAQPMIEQSNDDDAQALWDAEGGATAVGRFDRSAGLTLTTPDAAGYWGLSTTTALDQLQLLKAVAYPNDLLTAASRAYELGLMSNVDADQTWGVSAGVAPGSIIAIKNGWLPLDSGGWQMNSIGYINGDDHDYLIAILSNANATEAQGIETIEGLSTLIWQELTPAA